MDAVRDLMAVEREQVFNSMLGPLIGRPRSLPLFFGGNDVHRTKKAVMNGASYLAFGAFYSSKTKKVKYKASLKILRLAKKLTNVPVVAIGGIKNANYKKLLLNKANFLAISGYIWNNKKLNPIEAINKLI